MWKQPKPLEPSTVSRTLLPPIRCTVQMNIVLNANVYWLQHHNDKVCALMSPKERSIQAHGCIPSLLGSGRWAGCQDSRSMWERHSAPHITEGRSQRKWKTHWVLGVTLKCMSQVTCFLQLCLPPKLSRNFQRSTTSWGPTHEPVGEHVRQ